MELCCCPKHQHDEGHSTCRRASPSQPGFLTIIPGLSGRLRKRTNRSILAVVNIQQTECTTSSFDSASNTVYSSYLYLLKAKISNTQVLPPVLHYYTHPLQLNQNEVKRGLITTYQCIRIHRFWELWHYSKNCWRSTGKCFAPHEQESSLSGNIPYFQHEILNWSRGCTLHHTLG